MPFSESADQQSVKYRSKPGKKATTYSVKRYDTSTVDHVMNAYDSIANNRHYQKLPDRTFTLERTKGRPRPFKGAKAEPKQFHHKLGGDTPKSMRIRRATPKERAEDRKTNTIAGGAAGTVGGAIIGGSLGGWKGAVKGSALGAGVGTGAGAAVRPNTHRLIREKKIKKNLNISAFGVEH